jgi:4-hydroxy-tetrahydrodipicolinate reductase
MDVFNITFKLGKNNMHIVIIGYGRMGKEVENSARQLSIPVAKIIDSIDQLKEYRFSPNEVAIEFTEPEAFLDNIKLLCAKKVVTVTGTTGWCSEQEKVERLVKESEIGFLYSSNFSIGVNLFWKVLGFTAKLMNNFAQYDIALHETHHKEKQDSPSGTALQSADIILQNLSRKSDIVVDKLDRKINPDELHVSSTRSGYTVGEHHAIFDSLSDSLTITHAAKNRLGYAHGAIACAKWLYQNQHKGIFTMHDYMQELQI